MASTVTSGNTVVTSPVVQFLGQDVQVAGAAGTIGAFGATPVAQPGAIANATDAASAITQLNLALAALRSLGLIAS
jgi:hypothetical protein